ncbi:DUF5977 domain-containing protein [Chryseobacterium sp. Mn2064]|uniref:DUF5977 domain-containing protein n=1 Tax=Chryseobacterium sp. Mn2064 TaxID=3395263 RepID=UPI003BEB4514
MTKFRFYLTGIFLILCQIIHAQGKTLEDYSLGKKVNVSNNYNVGKLNLSIPLYNIDLGNISLKGSVDYLQEIPKTEPGMVGFNWNYNMFGKITIAYKKPGVLHEPRFLGANMSSGFYPTSRNNCLVTGPGTVTKKQLLTNPNTNTSFYVYEPNTFYFDFMGYSGYMIFDNVGKFLVYSENGNLTASYNGEKCHNIFQPINSFPEIVMKDDKGNEFYFGGDYNSNDIYYSKSKYTYSSWRDDGTFTYFTDYYTNRQVNYISALYLKKVKLPNGRIIEAFYKNSNRSILDPFTNGGEYLKGDYPSGIPSNSILLNNNIFLGSGNGNDFSNNSSSSTNNGPNDTSSTMSLTNVNIYQKLAILDSIRVSDYGSLMFDYIQAGNSFTKPFLKKIELKSFKKNIKKIAFNYTGKSLESINNNNEIYSFNYYGGTNGYQVDPSGIQYYSGFGGMLKSIVYPTRGKEEFEYEQNDVSKINYFVRSSFGTEGNSLVDKESRIDGQRLKTVTTYDNMNQPIGIKKYDYLNDAGKSSGILTYKDQTSAFVDSFNWFGEGATTLVSTTRGYYDDHVRYSRVTEEITGKEKNLFYFTDLISNPDSLATKVHSSNGLPNAAQIVQSKLPLKINKNNERGKLYKTIKHDANMFAVSTQNIKYTNFLNGVNPVNEVSNVCTSCKISDDKYYVEAKASVWAPNSSNPSQLEYIGYYQYQPVLPYLPISIKTTEQIPTQIINGNYVGSKLIDSQKYIKYTNSYLYWHPNPIETIDYLPYEWPLPWNQPVYNGKIISRTTYPQDLIRNNSSCITGNCPPDNDQVGGKLSIYKYMADNGIITPIITSVMNNNNKVSLTENVYSKDVTTNNILKISKQRQSLLDSNFTLDTPSSAAVEETVNYQLYDNLGNLIQFKNANGIPTTILYGYKQSLPIAEIIGATYSQVMQAYNLDPATSTSYLQLDIVKKSDLDTNESAESNLVTALDNFRLKTELKDFQISTYVYDPLIGIKTSTNPNGKKEFYKYDALNRPKKVLDTHGNPLKVYDYNLSPKRFYNAFLLKNFYRTNCGAGFEGGVYGYIVPENKFFSTIDQADADQKALDDANANGQNEANMYATCFPKESCPFTMANNFVALSTDVYTYYGNIVVKVNFRNYPINASYWNNEIKIGQMGGNCKPSVERNINNYVEPPGGSFGNTPANRTWSIRIDTAGNIYVKLLSGSVGNNSANPLKFDFVF